MRINPIALAGFFDELSVAIHELNDKWWRDPVTRERIPRNKGEMIALMHSELSEMLEAERKSLPSDKIPGFTGAEEELADLFIRGLDYAGGHSLRLGPAIVAKLAYNAIRADHTFEARAKADGKKF